jgi:hypothetical protein
MHHQHVGKVHPHRQRREVFLRVVADLGQVGGDRERADRTERSTISTVCRALATARGKVCGGGSAGASGELVVAFIQAHVAAPIRADEPLLLHGM